MSVDAFFGKFSSDLRRELSDEHMCIWENDSNVKNCRHCFKAFSFTRRKHHCRCCGGIFCDSCTVSNANIADKGVIAVACIGCRNLETPGDHIREHIENFLENHGHDSAIQAQAIKIIKGAKYELPTEADKPPTSGYFEFCNKSDQPCGVKVLISGSNFMWEAPRPSYILLQPNEACHCEFDPLTLFLDILVLYNLSSLSDISSPKISKFQDFVVYSVNSKGSNVLLKYRGNCNVELRAGGSTAVKNLFNRLSGAQTTKYSATPSSFIDFNTNVKTLDMKYKSG